MVSSIYKAFGSLALFNVASAVIPPYLRPELPHQKGGTYPITVQVSIGSNVDAGSSCGFDVTVETTKNRRTTFNFRNLAVSSTLSNNTQTIYVDYRANQQQSIVMISASEACRDDTQIDNIQVFGKTYFMEDSDFENPQGFWVSGDYTTQSNKTNYICVNGASCKLNWQQTNSVAKQTSTPASSLVVNINVGSETTCDAKPVTITVYDPLNEKTEIPFPSNLAAGTHTVSVPVNDQVSQYAMLAFITGGNCIVQINELFINGVPYALQSALSTYSVNSIPCLDNFSVSGGQQAGVEQAQCPFGATCGLASDAYFQCS